MDVRAESNPQPLLAPVSISAKALIDLLVACAVGRLVCVPDSYQRSLLAELENGRRLPLTVAATEDEAVAICAGLYFGGRAAALSIQHSGLFACVNTLRGLALDVHLPLLMLVGLLGREPQLAPEDSKSSMNRLARPVLDALGIRHALLDDPESLVAIREEAQRTLQERRPFAVLLGAPTV